MSEHDFDLGQRAMHGDEEAAKMYCGAYTLVQWSDGELFRCKGDIPSGFTRVDRQRGESVYDADGFLLSQYWSLPRLEDGR